MANYFVEQKLKGVRYQGQETWGYKTSACWKNCCGGLLWKEVISNKYGQNSPWISNMVNIPYGVSVQRTIRNLQGQLQHNIRYKVENKTRILFLKDPQIGQGTLMSSYPDIYVLSSSPDAIINEVWSKQGWNVRFKRLLNDWEIGRVVDIL